MTGFLKRNFVTVVNIILICAIICLSVGIYKRGKTADAPPLNDGDIEDVSDVRPADGEPATAETPPEPESKKPTEYFPVLPKPAKPSDACLFVQNICGLGDVALKNVCRTSSGLYAIVENSCKIGDISSDVPTVGIAFMDSPGTITKTFSVPCNTKSSYAASQITAQGLVVVTRNTSKRYLYVHIIDENLETVVTKPVSFAEKAEVFPTDNSFLILAGNRGSGIIYRYADGDFRLLPIESADIVRVFDYGVYYRIFYNTDAGYAYCDITAEGFSKREVRNFDTGGKLVDIFPLTENDGQIFMLLETSGKELIATKYDAAFRNSRSQSLGRVEVGGVCAEKNLVRIAVNGAINGVITVYSDLGCGFALNPPDFGISKIYDSVFYGETFYMLAADENDRLALIAVSDGTSNIEFLDLNTDSALLSVNPNGTLNVVYDSSFGEYSAVGIIGAAA